MNLYAFISNNSVNSYDVLGREDGLWGPNPNGGGNWVSLDGMTGDDYARQGAARANSEANQMMGWQIISALELASYLKEEDKKGIARMLEQNQSGNGKGFSAYGTDSNEKKKMKLPSDDEDFITLSRFDVFAIKLKNEPFIRGGFGDGDWEQVRDQRDMLFARANEAFTELRSRGVTQHAGPLTAYSCQQVNSVLYAALGPLPEGWTVKLERRATDRGFQLLDLDHWAVVAKAPAPWNAEYLFDYWGQRPIGESPEVWFRDHFPRVMPFGDVYIPFVPQTNLPIQYNPFQDMNELYPKK